MKFLFLIGFLLHSAVLAAPIESRKWEATGGHSTEASAISATATSVTLQLANGKTIEVPLEKLVPADRELILSHFKIELPKEGDPERSDAAPLSPTGLDHPLGKVSGPVESAPGSHYFIYLPSTLKAGRPAPVLHFNDSGPVTADKMKSFAPACERFGWILVGSVESSNKTHGDPNHKHAVNNVNALKESPLVDPERIYFTGGSGGGAMSWWNFAKLRAAGTMPIIGYIPREVSPSGGHHFVIGGARDYNRYLGANAADKFGKDAIYRPYPGQHARPKEDWVYQEGVAWLTAKYLEKNERDSALAGDRLDFEAAMIDWMDELTPEQPYLAYHLGTMMRDTYGVSGKNAVVIGKKLTELGGVAANKQFSEGLAAIHEFGVKTMAEKGANGGSAMKTAFPEHNRKLEKLAEDYAGIPFVATVLEELAQPTQGK